MSKKTQKKKTPVKKKNNKIGTRALAWILAIMMVITLAVSATSFISHFHGGEVDHDHDGDGVPDHSADEHDQSSNDQSNDDHDHDGDGIPDHSADAHE